MTRREALAIARLWKSWAAGRTINNRTYREFVLDVVGIDPGLQQLSVFEILDAMVNGEAWEIGGAADASGVAPPAAPAPAIRPKTAPAVNPVPPG